MRKDKYPRLRYHDSTHRSIHLCRVCRITQDIYNEDSQIQNEKGTAQAVSFTTQLNN